MTVQWTVRAAPCRPQADESIPVINFSFPRAARRRTNPWLSVVITASVWYYINNKDICREYPYGNMGFI